MFLKQALVAQQKLYKDSKRKKDLSKMTFDMSLKKFNAMTYHYIHIRISTIWNADKFIQQHILSLTAKIIQIDTLEDTGNVFQN